VNDNISASYPLYNGITCFNVKSQGRDIDLFNATPRRTVVEAWAERLECLVPRDKAVPIRVESKSHDNDEVQD